MPIDWKEIQEFLIISVVLGFIFSFRTWGDTVFNASTGIRNFVMITILVIFSVLIHEVVQRWYGSRHGVTIRFKTWGLLIIAAIVITILTNGYFPFAAIWVMTISRGSRDSLFRLGRTHLGPYERAKIALAGPLANFILFVIAAYFFYRNPVFLWEQLMFINAGLAIFNVFPFFRVIPAVIIGSTRTIHNFAYKTRKTLQMRLEGIPYMEGEILFFGSRPMGVFFFSLMLTAISVVYIFENIFWGAIISLVFSFSIYLAWMYWFEPWGKYSTLERKKPLKIGANR